jgi:hypothetical protein
VDNRTVEVIMRNYRVVFYVLSPCRMRVQVDIWTHSTADAVERAVKLAHTTFISPHIRVSFSFHGIEVTHTFDYIQGKRGEYELVGPPDPNR